MTAEQYVQRAAIEEQETSAGFAVVDVDRLAVADGVELGPPSVTSVPASASADGATARRKNSARGQTAGDRPRPCLQSAGRAGFEVRDAVGVEIDAGKIDDVSSAEAGQGDGRHSVAIISDKPPEPKSMGPVTSAPAFNAKMPADITVVPSSSPAGIDHHLAAAKGQDAACQRASFDDRFASAIDNGAGHGAAGKNDLLAAE